MSLDDALKCCDKWADCDKFNGDILARRVEILQKQNNQTLALEYCDQWLHDNIYDARAY